MEINKKYLSQIEERQKDLKEKLEIEIKLHDSIEKCKGVNIVSDGHFEEFGNYKWYQCKHLNNDLTCKLDKNNGLCNNNHITKYFLFIPYKKCEYKDMTRSGDIYEEYEKCCDRRDNYKKLLRKG